MSVPLGQNTPLTLVARFTAESGGDQTRDGLSPTAPGALYLTGGLQHLRNGAGGEYALQPISTTDCVLPIPGGVALREFLVGAPVWANGGATNYWAMRAGETVLGFQINSGNAAVLSTGGVVVTQLAFGTTGQFANNEYNWVMFHGRIGASGFMKLRLYSYDNLIVEYSGDTQPLAKSTMDSLQMEAGINGDCRFDDTYVYARSIYFTGALGTTPGIGDTITDSITGATAVVDYVQTSGATGVFFLSFLVGSFGSGNAITSGLWSATASNALTDNKASLWVDELFGVPGTLTADVQTQWPVPASPPHYSLVDDWFDTTDYVATSTSGQTDVYATDFPTLPVSAVIAALVISSLGELNGSTAVTKLVLGYNDGVGNQDGPSQFLPSSWGTDIVPWTNNTRTATAFTVSEILALNLRLGSLT